MWRISLSRAGEAPRGSGAGSLVDRGWRGGGGAGAPRSAMPPPVPPFLSLSLLYPSPPSPYLPGVYPSPPSRARAPATGGTAGEVRGPGGLAARAGHQVHVLAPGA